MDLQRRLQTLLRLPPAAPDPDAALAELLLASSSSRAVFKSCTRASMFFEAAAASMPTIFFLVLDGDGGSDFL